MRQRRLQPGGDLQHRPGYPPRADAAHQRLLFTAGSGAVPRYLQFSVKYKEQCQADTYFILKDFRSYAEAQKRVEVAYRDENWWARAAMLNTASAGKFSSDRTIEEYVRDIWHLEKIHVDDDDVKAL